MFWKRHNRTACLRHEVQLEDYLEGHLRQDLVAELETHLGQCQKCRGALEAARSSLRLLAGWEPVEDPGATFTRRVMAAIRDAETRLAGRNFWRPLEVLAWRLSLSAVLALVLLVIYLFSLPPSRRPQMIQPERAEVQELFPESAPRPADRDEVLLTLAANPNSGANHGR